MKQSFSTSEVAKYCHVTPDTIRKWAEAGRIRVFKTPGGHRRIRREDLLQFLRENSIPVHGDLRDAGLKVLVMDPERSTASVIQRFLERSPQSFQVAVATDAFESGRQLVSFQPDIVFLDLWMPNMDGVAVCGQIKRADSHPVSHLIAMAAGDDADLFSRALGQGASLCMRKPFTPDDLRRALAKVGVEVS